MKKKIVWKMGIGMILVMGLLTGCGGQKTETKETKMETVKTEVTEGQETESEDLQTERQKKEEYATKSVSVAGWKITVENVKKNTSLENVSVELGYTGVETSDFKKDAEEGKMFCMIKMLIEKDGSKETIEWNKLKLKDENGNEYTRMEDEFLTELGMTRMTGNTLNFGSNEGWIAFEIDENAENLELNYSFETEEYQCVL